jgi:hypothetical protein
MAAFQIAFLPPINDEADYAAPAVSLVRNGNFGSPLFEPQGDRFPGRDKITYYLMPGHPLTNAVVMAVFGVGLTPLRVKALIFMAVAIVLVFRILKETGLPRPYAALAIALLCVDRNWLQASVVARSDAQAFCLGIVGAYLFTTRVRDHKPLGAFLGGVIIGMAFVTHVNCVMFGFVCLVVALRELRANFRNLSVYAGGLGLLPVMGMYLAFTRLYPTYYQAQMGWVSGVSGRLDAWSHPFHGVWTEIHRWAPLYEPTNGGIGQQLAYLVISAISLGALVALCLRRRGPTASLQPIAALYTIGAIFTFAFFNNLSTANYFFYRSFIADICIVALLAWFSGTSMVRARTLWAGAVTLAFAFHVSKDVVFFRNSLQAHDDYASLGRALTATRKSDEAIIGPSELAFAYGFSPNYRVDENFGFYSGRRPTLLALYVDESGSQSTVVESAFGGACAGNVERAASYTAFGGAVIAAQLARNFDQICAYVRGLAVGGTTVYRGRRYEILRIAGTGS